MVLVDQALAEPNSSSHPQEIRRDLVHGTYGRRTSDQYALQLRAWAEQDDAAECEVATPPVWVTTAPVRVEAAATVQHSITSA